MKEILTCPLGSDCEKMVDKRTVEKCMWFVKLAGTNPSTGESIDEESCAIRWLPLLQVQISKTNRGQTQAIESFRNEIVNQQDQFNTIADRLV